MNTFIQIIDKYLLNYSTYSNDYIYFECEQGELIFYKNKSDTITIHGIYINPEYRERGHCRDILYYLIDKSNDNPNEKFKFLHIQSVISKILYEYLIRFKYKNSNFKLKKNGFYYKL